MHRSALRVIDGGRGPAVEWGWFCGHCAAPSPNGSAPAPGARVCAHCGLGVLLETRVDAIPRADEAFLVVDARLLIQAMSREAEAVLGLCEEAAIDRPVSELLLPADAEAARTGFAGAIVEAADGREPETASGFVRPWNTFGVRLRVRIATCGPPRAALIVLDAGRAPQRGARLDNVTSLRERRHLSRIR